MPCQNPKSETWPPFPSLLWLPIGNPNFSTSCIRHIASLSKGFLDLMLQATLCVPLMIGLWTRNANYGFDHVAWGITNALPLDITIPRYLIFLLQLFKGCFNPSGLPLLSHLPPFFRPALLIWPVGLPLFPPPSPSFCLLFTPSLLAPSSPLRAARLPWGSKVICAVSLPWGSKVICCSPYGTIVLDSL